jgi:hypothetical protein
MTTAYPLQWPDGRPRTPAHRRTKAAFSTTFAVARDNLVAEVRRLGGRNLVISTNVPLRQDGLPSARARLTIAVPMPNASAVLLMVAPCSARHALIAA